MNNNLRIATLGVLSAALLASCGATNKAPTATQAADNILTLTGKLSGASGGTATLGNNLSSSAVASDGSFSFNLPGSAVMDNMKKDLNNGFLSDFNCQTQLSSDTSGIKVYAFGSVNYNGQQYFDLSADRKLTNVKAGGRVYLYSDTAAHITGTLSCSVSGITLKTLKADVNVTPGWNVLGLDGENGGLFNLTEFTGKIYNTSKADGSLWVNSDQLKKQVGI